MVTKTAIHHQSFPVPAGGMLDVAFCLGVGARVGLAVGMPVATLRVGAPVLTLNWQMTPIVLFGQLQVELKITSDVPTPALDLELASMMETSSAEWTRRLPSNTWQVPLFWQGLTAHGVVERQVDGEIDGEIDGDMLGELVDDIDGASDGKMLGEADGEIDGEIDVDLLGELVGVDGAMVGLLEVGAAVGHSVPLEITLPSSSKPTNMTVQSIQARFARRS